MLLSDVFVLLILTCLALIWWWDRGIKQAAFLKCKQYCENADVLLLDDNIQIKKIKLEKNSQNQWKILRVFQFEFTYTSEERYQGTLEMLGQYIKHIELEPYKI